MVAEADVAKHAGQNPDKIMAQISKAVSDLEIETLKNRNVFKMSGGEKQLLAIASLLDGTI